MNRQAAGLFVLLVVLIGLNIVIWRDALTPAHPQGDGAPTRLPTASLPRQAPLATRIATAAAVASPARLIETPPAAASAPARTPTSAPPTPTRTPSLPANSPTPAVLTSLDEIATAVQGGRHGAPFHVTFSELEIRREIAAYLRDSGDVAFSDIQVMLQPGAAVIAGKARVVAFNVGFTATTTVVVVNGRPRLKVVQLDLLGGLVPGAIKDLLIQMIEQSADLPLLADLPVTIERVDIEQGQAVISGTVA